MLDTEQDKRIRVVIVDDSSVMRILLRDLLGRDERIEVVGSAVDPFYAKDMIQKLRPDVVTLDVEMPRMDGVTFLGKLMRFHPVPVVMVSTHTAAGTDAALQALDRGAIDVIAKPTDTSEARLGQYAKALTRKIIDAAQAKRKIERIASQRAEATVTSTVGMRPLDRKPTHFIRPGVGLIGIGGSTGSPQAMRVLVRDLPEDTPGTVVAIHLPARYTASFAQRLDKVAAMRVVQAEDQQPIEAGHIYIAPGGQHLRVVGNIGALTCRLDRGEKVNGFRPSVDILFESVRAAAGSAAAAILLSGMGRDGAAQMAAIRQAGGFTVAQDEASSVVWGMPGAAVAADGVDALLPLSEIAPTLSGTNRESTRAIA